MTRAWAFFLDALDDVFGVAWVVFVLFVGSVVFGLLHYFYPRWVPDGLPSFLRRRKRKTTQEPAPELVEPLPLPDPEPDAELPDLPAHVFTSLADRLAAEGRFAEAVRERLRAIVRGLVERRILEHRPGMTVTELAHAAAAVVPAIDSPLRSATGIFSDIWYGERPATAEHDNRMRQLAAEVGA
ncbi:DUF4129 domain-containing protein [Dactylosporangium roseum]|uniref:DUF4129 domain-containing protein n=1 Tax=Dactylosporangium roseum TaxID=47989 RepID=A0ABY5Z471_9ACTN|nr:DUF4129 domain-containing protein [Dactylosporangium roseum]UWZ35850.1 DUF4129 domain-containing protein [Dactylosporangium roseum]